MKFTTNGADRTEKEAIMAVAKAKDAKKEAIGAA